MSLLPFFEWMLQHPMSVYFLDTTWATPIVQLIHLVAVAVFAGAILVVDLRLMGLGLTRTRLAQVARDAQPWLIWSFVILLVTGIPQMSSTALKQYYSPFFWWKMEAMLLGLIFTFTFRRWLVRTDDARLGPLWPKVAGLFSISLWSGVTIGARLIGLLS